MSGAGEDRTVCPYCRAEAWRPGPERGPLRYRTCRACGSAWLAQDVLTYADYYDAYDPEQVREAAPILRDRYRTMLARIEARAPGRRLLEVGCGNGHFLAEARERGWTVAGLELSRSHVERARARGLEVRHGILEDGLFDAEPWDAVAAIEVLEHVPDPGAFLAECSRRLRPRGVLFLTTPNFGSLTRRVVGARWSVLGAEHVTLASPRGLRIALGRAGHEVVELASRSLFLSEYRALLPGRRGAPGASRVEAAVELRDRIEESSALRLAKAAVNRVLAVTGVGESMECLSVRAVGAG